MIIYNYVHFVEKGKKKNLHFYLKKIGLGVAYRFDFSLQIYKSRSELQIEVYISNNKLSFLTIYLCNFVEKKKKKKK